MVYDEFLDIKHLISNTTNAWCVTMNGKLWSEALYKDGGTRIWLGGGDGESIIAP